MTDTATLKRKGGRPKMPAKVPGSGRQRGTPNKATAGLKAAFQEHEEKLVKALLKLVESMDENVRIKAIQACFDRGWGRPAQHISADMAYSYKTVAGPEFDRWITGLFDGPKDADVPLGWRE